jgi:hypothetical protein
MNNYNSYEKSFFGELLSGKWVRAPQQHSLPTPNELNDLNYPKREKNYKKIDERVLRALL